MPPDAAAKQPRRQLRPKARPPPRRHTPRHAQSTAKDARNARNPTPRTGANWRHWARQCAHRAGAGGENRTHNGTAGREPPCRRLAVGRRHRHRYPPPPGDDTGRNRTSRPFPQRPHRHDIPPSAATDATGRCPDAGSLRYRCVSQNANRAPRHSRRPTAKSRSPSGRRGRHLRARRPSTKNGFPIKNP